MKNPPLIKVALAHVQFETIHSFLDGNGRVGRLLIPLIVREERVLPYPLLHLSLFFKKHRARYYEHLQEVRLKGHWELWLDFFFQGVRDIAERTASDIQQALALFELFHPRQQHWDEYFRWEELHIVGQTDTGHSPRTHSFLIFTLISLI